MTECNQDSFEFEELFSRQVVARFDGGTISSDAGGLLLRETDRRIRLLKRLRDCFRDGRNPARVEHGSNRCWRSAFMHWRWAMKISMITTSCGRIRCWRCWRERAIPQGRIGNDNGIRASRWRARAH